MDKFLEFIRKGFGKEKDNRIHAIIMLFFYFLFITILVVVIRMTPYNSEENNNNNGNNQGEIVNPKDNLDDPEEDPEDDINENEVTTSYSFSCKIDYDGEIEQYIGKKNTNKEIFTLIKGNNISEYGILNGNYLIKENDKYHLTDKLDGYYKYCDVGSILDSVSNSMYTEESDRSIYHVDNKEIARAFNDKKIDNNNKSNDIIVYMDNDNLKKIEVNISNYITTSLEEEHKLNIVIEVADIGTTEDINIEME